MNTDRAIASFPVPHPDAPTFVKDSKIEIVESAIQYIIQTKKGKLEPFQKTEAAGGDRSCQCQKQITTRLDGS